jgi:hypothetical protein
MIFYRADLYQLRMMLQTMLLKCLKRGMLLQKRRMVWAESVLLKDMLIVVDARGMLRNTGVSFSSRVLFLYAIVEGEVSI